MVINKSLVFRGSTLTELNLIHLVGVLISKRLRISECYVELWVLKDNIDLKEEHVLEHQEVVQDLIALQHLLQMKEQDNIVQLLDMSLNLPIQLDQWPVGTTMLLLQAVEAVTDRTFTKTTALVDMSNT